MNTVTLHNQSYWFENSGIHLKPLDATVISQQQQNKNCYALTEKTHVIEVQLEKRLSLSSNQVFMHFTHFEVIKKLNP
jgi:uncharacterized protein YcfL